MESLSRTAPSLFVCFVLVSLLVPSLGQGPDLTPSEQKLISELTRRMDYFQQKLTEAVNAAENLNIDCLGINQDICAAMKMQSNKADQMSLGSPGKRSSSAVENSAEESPFEAWLSRLFLSHLLYCTVALPVLEIMQSISCFRVLWSLL
ncbi:hypothetical protein EGW08_001990 [Elysia chlorotica]|uniref:Calcitonin peptide-like domain-containing protein n=1 Tax=Elysia chlorotica TaxID=188477 RepID=A0A3S1AF54_ELYCH|nr:hypothetical protein EGW08_001990 [Elysia chlorotica]